MRGWTGPTHLATARLAAATCVGAVLFAACKSSGESSQSRKAVDRYDTVYAALCDAETAFNANDPGRGRRVFLDRVHQSVHELAAATEERDRAAAARLLEAKQAVEAGLGNEPDARLASNLGRLRRAALAAIEVLGIDAPPPCNRGDEP